MHIRTGGTHHPTLIALAACVFLVLVIILRITAPSDFWEYTQHKTVSYTTDILVHGDWRWILPMDKGEIPATKPPLYNWIAVPFVKILGFSSDIAHKFPSILAMCACWVVMVRLGNALAKEHMLGWLLGMILIANHTMMKLGYIARPDMMLTLWLTGAWITATATFAVNEKSKFGKFALPFAFWIFVALSTISKGPASLVAIAFAFVAARVLGGSWGAVRMLHPVAGIVFVVVLSGAWLFAAYRINPQHVTETLWKQEFLSRIQGTNPDIVGDAGGGMLGWIKSLPYHPLYFLGRFFPWSIAAILAMIAIWSRTFTASDSKPFTPESAHGSMTHDPSRISSDQQHLSLYLRSAALFILIVIAIYSLSTGKRADYIAAAFPPSSLLAAWWIIRTFSSARARWIVPGIAAIAIGIHGWRYHFALDEPTPGYSSATSNFVQDAAAAMNDRPLPLVVCPIGNSHVPALLGHSGPHSVEAALAAVESGEPFWLLTSARDANCAQILSQNHQTLIEERAATRLQDTSFGLKLYLITPERTPAEHE